MRYVFGDTAKSNAEAARFFKRWLALQNMGWHRDRALGMLKEDPGLTAAWRDFAAQAHAVVVVDDNTSNWLAKQESLRGTTNTPLHELFETSPLLTHYVREVLLAGSTLAALTTLLDVYEFERHLPASA